MDSLHHTAVATAAAAAAAIVTRDNSSTKDRSISRPLDEEGQLVSLIY